MAYFGLAYPTFAKLNTTTGAYSNGFRMGKAVSTNMTINENEAKQPGDNITAEIVKEFKDGTISLGVTTIPIVAYNTVFGHTVTIKESSVNIVDKTDDLANYVGVGLIKYELVDGVKKYVALWIYKALFTESGDSAQTSGENITFQTPTINGTILALPGKQWREREIFNTELAAQDWIDAKAGIIDVCTTPEASLESGTYTAVQAAGITLTAGAGETIYYTKNGTTPSATNGTEYTVAIDITASCALKAIAVKEGSSNSAIAVYEYLITA
jgi:phi13 family phage major tail protein